MVKKVSKDLKVCKICMKDIFNQEHYCFLTEFQEGKEKSVGYYHVTCFRERFMKFDKLQKDANSVLGMAKKAFNRMGIEQ